MSKNLYWIADVEGVKALVEGADERDRWVKVHGWSETTEPEGLEFVWLENEYTGGRQKFNAQAAADPAWAARGWHPSPPEEPVNRALPPERAVPVAPEKTSAPNPKPAADATSGKIKE